MNLQHRKLIQKRRSFQQNQLFSQQSIQKDYYQYRQLMHLNNSNTNNKIINKISNKIFTIQDPILKNHYHQLKNLFYAKQKLYTAPLKNFTNLKQRGTRKNHLNKQVYNSEQRLIKSKGLKKRNGRELIELTLQDKLKLLKFSKFEEQQEFRRLIEKKIESERKKLGSNETMFQENVKKFIENKLILQKFIQNLNKNSAEAYNEKLINLPLYFQIKRELIQSFLGQNLISNSSEKIRSQHKRIQIHRRQKTQKIQNKIKMKDTMNYNQQMQQDIQNRINAFNKVLIQIYLSKGMKNQQEELINFNLKNQSKIARFEQQKKKFLHIQRNQLKSKQYLLKHKNKSRKIPNETQNIIQPKFEQVVVPIIPIKNSIFKHSKKHAKYIWNIKQINSDCFYQKHTKRDFSPNQDQLINLENIDITTFENLNNFHK